jgi:PhoPQ-activated pathogenicity-related protein
VITTPEKLDDAILWSALSTDRDFRDELWSDSILNASGKDKIIFEVRYPGTGFKAFYIDLKYKAPFGGGYTESTRMFVADENKLLLKTE